MKHRLQGDKKTLASDGQMAGHANSLGGILGCKMAFYALFPRRKAQGCGDKDSGDGGHGG